MSLKNKILAFLSSEEPTEVVKLSEEKLENGTVLVSDDFKEGNPIFIKSEDEDGEDVKLPIGEYQMEDGRVLTVSVEGEIASMEDGKTDEAEEPAEEPAEEVAMEESNEEETEEVVAEEHDGEENHMQAMMDRLDALEAAMEAMNTPSEEVAEEVEASTELSAEVEVEEVVVEASEEVAPIAHSPEATDTVRARFYFPKN
tara:strand:+ start:2187 stop:2786 length:600 start_codon:yes stop_codon:yes gene_type:complete